MVIAGTVHNRSSALQGWLVKSSSSSSLPSATSSGCNNARACSTLLLISSLIPLCALSTATPPASRPTPHTTYTCTPSTQTRIVPPSTVTCSSPYAYPRSPATNATTSAGSSYGAASHNVDNGTRSHSCAAARATLPCAGRGYFRWVNTACRLLSPVCTKAWRTTDAMTSTSGLHTHCTAYAYHPPGDFVPASA